MTCPKCEERKPLREWIEQATKEGTYFRNYHGFGGDHYGIPVEDFERIMSEELTAEEYSYKAAGCSKMFISKQTTDKEPSS